MKTKILYTLSFITIILTFVIAQTDNGWIGIADFAVRENFSVTHDSITRKIIIVKDNDNYTFAQDNQFYTVNTDVRVLQDVPTLRNGKISLPESVLNEIFGIRRQGQQSQQVATTSSSSATSSTTSTTTTAARTSSSSSTTTTTTPATAPTPTIVQPQEIPVIRTIVIDPGHGGRDPGAIGPSGVMEKDVVLAISLELRTLLQRAGFTVHMTRDTDVFIPLRDRTRFANEKRADLFVSIHANAIDGSQRRRDSVRGYKIYFLSQARNDEEKLSAMRENAAVEFEDIATRENYDMLQDLLTNIIGNEYLRESQELSILMEQTFGSRQSRIPRSQLGVGQANFWVLNGAFMPAVLVETGFISHTQEERLLATPAVQRELAAALSESIIAFKNMFEGQ